MEVNENISMSISGFAILISLFAIGITYFQNSKLQKRQIRVSKLEEMLEIIIILKNYYKFFEETLLLKNEMLNNSAETVRNKIYDTQINIIRRIIDIEKLETKLPRLYVLNSSYLPKSKLKDKISVFITLFASIINSTATNPDKCIESEFKKFLNKYDFSDFTNEIANEIIEEMNLGYKGDVGRDNDYIEEFKKRYQL